MPTTPAGVPASFPDSTPITRASAANFQTLDDESAGNPKKIANVMEDLKKREHCSFIAMLKALMLRQVMMNDSGREVFEATTEEREAVDQKFKILLDDAVGFVNGKAGSKLRAELKRYCNIASVTPRYLPFVSALNEILLHFRGLKSKDNTINPGDIIFAINDPAIIESNHLQNATNRKPDLICLLAANFANKNSDFNGCMDKAKKKRTSSTKITWGDVLQSWEMEANQKICLRIRENFTAQEFLDWESTSQASAIGSDELVGASTSQASAVGRGKRKRSSGSIPFAKKMKTDLLPLVNLLKIVQCTYYAIERLRHSLHITHAMNVLLNDAELTLYWFDSQGCIETDTINIIKNLPLLVVMIGIFENFPLGMWGYTPIDIWSEDEQREKVYYSRKGASVRSFQVKGCRTFTADALKLPAHTVTAPTTATASTTTSSGHLNEPAQPSSSRDGLEDERSEDILFLKSAWPEMKRRKEPEVINIAYDRAKELLGTEAPSVTDHLPVLVNFKELAYTSTEIIRHLVKSSTTDGFRVQLWMLSKKLQPIHVLDPLWTAFWHTLRCHALLWRIGIVHGDVTLSNLMCKEDNRYGVLNDFDLSTIMDPGSRHPNRQGLERTGTLAFMAVELLKDEGFDGKIPWRYDHELESFTWVLVWVSRCVHNGDQIYPPHRLAQWINNNNDAVYASKIAFVVGQKSIPMTEDYKSLSTMLGTWVTENFLRYINDESASKTPTEHLQALIGLCERSAHGDPFVAVPIEVAWINGLADLKFSTPSASE